MEKSLEESMQELEKELPGINVRVGLGEEEVPIEFSLGFRIMNHLPTTWKIVKAAASHGFPKEKITDFVKEGLVDEDIPYCEDDLKPLLKKAMINRFLVAQRRHLAVPFSVKEHRYVMHVDEVPFVRERRDLHCSACGSYATVYKVRDADGTPYACKVSSSQKVGNAERELLAYLLPESACHLLTLRASYTLHDQLHMIISPWVDLTLDKFLQSHSGLKWWTIIQEAHGEEQTITSWMACLATALCALHSYKIKHMDLKPDNIGFTIHEKEMEVVPYILDYGCSKSFRTKSSQMIDNSGAPYYSSPEKVKGKPEGRKGDIFSLGIVFMELVLVLLPSSRKFFKKLLKRDESSVWQRLAESEGSLDSVILSLLPQTTQFWTMLTSLLRSMLQYNPDSRPTAKKVWANLVNIHEVMEWRVHCCEVVKTPSPNKLAPMKEEINEGLDDASSPSDHGKSSPAQIDQDSGSCALELPLLNLEDHLKEEFADSSSNEEGLEAAADVIKFYATAPRNMGDGSVEAMDETGDQATLGEAKALNASKKGAVYIESEKRKATIHEADAAIKLQSDVQEHHGSTQPKGELKEAALRKAKQHVATSDRASFMWPTSHFPGARPKGMLGSDPVILQDAEFGATSEDASSHRAKTA